MRKGRSKENLLAFVDLQEKKLKKLTQELKLSTEVVKAVYDLAGISTSSQKYWEQHNCLYGKLGNRFYEVKAKIDQLLEEAVRASSIVENLNSRLRNYFFLRRHLGNEYLEVLRFFLNHCRFICSEHEERVGKSPAELLSGETHPHWLEMLGFTLFSKAA